MPISKTVMRLIHLNYYEGSARNIEDTQRVPSLWAAAINAGSAARAGAAHSMLQSTQPRAPTT
jgi:hypothetical protein